MMIPLLAVAAAAASAPLPADVRAFVRRHESCEHWIGEDAYDAARGREINAAIRRDCPGIDTMRTRLLSRYRARPTIVRVLRAHDRLDQ